MPEYIIDLLWDDEAAVWIAPKKLDKKILDQNPSPPHHAQKKGLKNFNP